MAATTGATRYGRLAGLGYVVIFALAIHANFAVIEALPSESGPAAVADFIRENAMLWRLAIAEFLVVMAVDIVVAYALYRLLEGRARGLNALSALFRLGYTVANIPVILMLLTALRWASAESVPNELSDAMAAQTALGYGPAFTLTLGFFGVHLVLLATAIIVSGRLPKVIGFLTGVAGLAYTLDALGYLLLPDLRTANISIVAPLVIVPALIGEGLLMLWLLFGPLKGRA
ncbi:DUF4386 domain-containing protein [Parvularcula lutaonensis]|uniref:DUF4386 domain-containing protein n=1 Tax=Parvularcula lutaonensis TaxID=491923 RepID=A0ABV7M9I3_9PROT|nr:DUF4386 domain-containing protein [Parvularcula lutaonensis]GGY47241.1 hypothetical protein GCM10007148_15670 [Parvularcula lutaonensis]